MTSWFRSVTTDSLFESQEKLWAEGRPLPTITRLSKKQRCHEEIRLIAQDIFRLKALMRGPGPEMLKARMSPIYKASLILVIDELRRQLKEVQKDHFGNPKLYKKARKELGDLRAKVLKCKVPKRKEGDLIDTSLDDELIDELCEIKREIAVAHDRINGPPTRQAAIDMMKYKSIKHDRKVRLIAITSVAVGAGVAGGLLAVSGAAALGVGTLGVGPAAVIGVAIPMLIFGELAVAVGPSIVLGGTTSAIIEWLGLEPAAKRFTRKHYPRQLGPADFHINGRARELDYDTRWNMINNWAKDFKVQIDEEEVSWYACIHNFPRWLRFRYVIDTEDNRSNLATLMKLERRHLLWSLESGAPPPCNELYLDDPILPQGDEGVDPSDSEDEIGQAS